MQLTSGTPILCCQEGKLGASSASVICSGSEKHAMEKQNVADANILVSIVELTPFLSISVCWFWFPD